MKKIFTLLCFIILIAPLVPAQHTVGLLFYKPSQSSEGYNLLYPHNQPNVYLLDNCGEVVKVWTDEADVRPGNTAYLLSNGNLVKAKRPASVMGDPIWAGGGGATVEIRNWDNDLLWSYTMNDSLQRFHHDLVPMPNGNLLMIAWELKTREESIQAGRDTNLLSQDELWPEKIVEIDPATSEIVWEWHTWDHLIQDFDPTKDNYGVVADHPELIDINYDTSDGRADWLHANSLDYNAELDQIMISIPTFSEIWIIDHSTTTEQAAGHQGGRGNRGGDLLYRFGNPQTYGAGDEEDQLLFYQHDAHWVDDYLPNSFPHLGKIAVFNNRVGEDYSTAHLFVPPWNMYKWRYDPTGGVWGPDEFDQTYQHPVPTRLYSTGLSSVQLLPNGNSLICSGRFGYSFEMTPDQHIVWEYKTPLLAGNPVAQGDTLEMNNNLTFRIRRIPPGDSALIGRDLTPMGYIELEPDSTYCQSILSSTVNVVQYGLKIFPNPADDHLTIEWEEGMYVQIEIVDLLGRRRTAFEASGGRRYVDIGDLEQGIYFVRINGVEVKKLLVL